MRKQWSAATLAEAYHWACMSELQALKPGNVHIFADGHGMTIQDFFKSADATAWLIAQDHIGVGQRIYLAVEATQQAVGLNTNLGLILLCAPLIHAALHANHQLSFTENLQATLAQLTIDDARLVARAIVLAQPAGLGKVATHDVNDQPNVSLLALMVAAQEQDRIAWQYANAYQDILGFGLVQYTTAMSRWDNRAWATCALYLSFLAYQPDSHIVRKYGIKVATEVMVEAQALEIEFSLSSNPKLVQKKLRAWDASLKSRNLNPGTSADLTVACLLASCLV
jgi:triphosphoribosyl-dephospho-CoA synthase